MTRNLERLQALAFAVGALLDGPQSDQTDTMDAVITAYDWCVDEEA